jgi:hypothetical protein
MRKHIYVNSSNLKYIEYIDKDEDFEHVSQYPPNEITKASAYEWGRIKTCSLYIHFIMGHVRDKNCPWCKSEVAFTPLNKDNPSDPFHYLGFCMQCMNCGSRGPVTKLMASSIITKDHEEQLRSLIECVFIERKNWDETELFKSKDGE